MKRPATTLTLIMLNIATTGSLNNLANLATVGLSAILYYFIALALFFIPYALIVAELASGYEQENGIYIWVKEAFGPAWGFTAAWLQWIENLFWYPTILSFIGATLSQIINPSLADNKIYNLIAALSIYWTLSLASLYGLRASALISLIGSSLGILIPGILLILFGGYWLGIDPSHWLMVNTSALPAHSPGNFALLVSIVLALAGLEVSAVHTPYVKNPQKAFPYAILVSTLLVLTFSILGSLAISALVPVHSLELNDGVAQAFGNFLHHFDIPYLENVLMVLIAIGGMTAASAWITGPSTSLAQAAKDHCLPTYFKKTNAAGISIPILMIQGILVSLLCGAFMVMPTVNNAYWLLTVIAGQLYLVMYLLMFAAAMKLRIKKLHGYAYQIKGVKTTWLICMIGSISCISFFLMGFLPPSSLGLANDSAHYFLQITALLILLSIPLIIYYLSFNNKAYLLSPSRG